jgi:hypothetical protein
MFSPIRSLTQSAGEDLKNTTKITPLSMGSRFTPLSRWFKPILGFHAILQASETLLGNMRLS